VDMLDNFIKQRNRLPRAERLNMLRWSMEEAQRHLARKHLLDFIQYTFPNYKAGWFHKHVCSELEEFFERVLRKENPRLIIVAPPQHGKSEIVSRRFPAWALGRCPELNIISTSYSSDRAEPNSRDVQNIISGERYQQLWQRKLAQKRVDMWDLEGYEQYKFRAAGIMGGITGLGAHIMIIDDPIKGWEDANSTIILEKLWSEMGAALKSRLAEGAGVLVMATRWNLRDPTGRLLDMMDNSGGFQWKVLHYDALIDESSDPPEERAKIGDYREFGEPLAPELFSREYLERVRKDYYDAGQGIIWLTLYQGRPQPTQGMGYFLSIGDEPEDKILRRYEARSVKPKRCSFEIVKPDKQWKFNDDDMGYWRVWEEPLPGFGYCAGLDISEGIDSGGDTDYHVLRILRRGVVDSVLEELHMIPSVTIGEIHKPAVILTYISKVDLSLLLEEVSQVLKYYNMAYLQVERNNPGIGFVDIGLRDHYPLELIVREAPLAQIKEKPGAKLGVRVTQANKATLLNRLKTAMRQDKFDDFDEEFLRQARHFVNIDGKLTAESGWHDDIVMATAHMWSAHLNTPLSIKKKNRIGKRSPHYRAENQLTGY